jgi:hypothetical protein
MWFFYFSHTENTIWKYDNTLWTDIDDSKTKANIIEKKKKIIIMEIVFLMKFVFALVLNTCVCILFSGCNFLKLSKLMCDFLSESFKTTSIAVVCSQQYNSIFFYFIFSNKNLGKCMMNKMDTMFEDNSIIPMKILSWKWKI